MNQTTRQFSFLLPISETKSALPRSYTSIDPRLHCGATPLVVHNSFHTMLGIGVRELHLHIPRGGVHFALSCLSKEALSRTFFVFIFFCSFNVDIHLFVLFGDSEANSAGKYLMSSVSSVIAGIMWTPGAPTSQNT